MFLINTGVLYSWFYIYGIWKLLSLRIWCWCLSLWYESWVYLWPSNAKLNIFTHQFRFFIIFWYRRCLLFSMNIPKIPHFRNLLHIFVAIWGHVSFPENLFNFLYFLMVVWRLLLILFIFISGIYLHIFAIFFY